MPRPQLPNKYIDIDESTMGIVFTQKGREITSIFDKEDFHRIRNFKWQLTGLSKRNKTRYVISRPWRSGPSDDWVMIFHQLIMSFPVTGVIDHINQNGLDNRKINLRVVTRFENARNKTYKRKSSSGYSGVYFDKKCPISPWKAEIRHLNNIIHIGHFSEKEAAAKAYDEKAFELRGGFASLNFPRKQDALPPHIQA